MGYPHLFERLTIVDLSPANRHEMYRELKLEDKQTANGPIDVLFTSFTDLSVIRGSSTDMVWMGAAIEHVNEEDGLRVFKEVRRVLRPGGNVCLDTNNRRISELHVQGQGWVHPEHQLEYSVAHLQNNLRESGFEIVDSWGVCEMSRTFETGQFDYTDFIFGCGLSRNVEACNLQYYRCEI